MPHVRNACIEDLRSFLALFEAVGFSPAVQPYDRAEQIWRETIESKLIAVFVIDGEKKVTATCTLISAPNLLRKGRQHGFLENVATHPDYRGRGFGRAVVTAALEHAWEGDCHHVLMQSGKADPRVHTFCERVGFQSGLRTGYVATRHNRKPHA